MKLNKKVLDFWEDTNSKLDHYVIEILKDYLKNKGWSESDYIFYDIENNGEFPIKVTHCESYHLKKYKTVIEVYKEDILKKINEE